MKIVIKKLWKFEWIKKIGLKLNRKKDYKDLPGFFNVIILFIFTKKKICTEI